MGSPACPVERAFKELNILVNTNSKEIIEKNKRHIAREIGGKKVFYDTMKSLMSGRMSAYNAAYHIAEGGSLLWRSADILAYLKRLGLKDEEKLMKYRTTKGTGPDYLYFALMARDGERLFKDIEKEKAKKSR